MAPCGKTKVFLVALPSTVASKCGCVTAGKGSSLASRQVRHPSQDDCGATDRLPLLGSTDAPVEHLRRGFVQASPPAQLRVPACRGPGPICTWQGPVRTPWKNSRRLHVFARVGLDSPASRRISWGVSAQVSPSPQCPWHVFQLIPVPRNTISSSGPSMAEGQPHRLPSSSLLPPRHPTPLHLSILWSPCEESAPERISMMAPTVLDLGHQLLVRCSHPHRLHSHAHNTASVDSAWMLPLVPTPLGDETHAHILSGATWRHPSWNRR
mmetsp:Transcript_58613/g.156053  ORF Transcript_58613/g.156053 Transcript_58613/m.156053 type:complete len:267 (+) Transcript_58613:730-1530(+)